MKIERLELFGYIRLMLTNIKKFVYVPEIPCQIILGTNGSGKSSILFELSPLPAQSGQYSKEGYKRVWVSHKGHQYVLESTFKHGNKHSFLKDGEELNSGGTGMVQKDLVQREFGYTQELHQLLIGDMRFTDMAPMKRREWITKLDAVDYVYPLGVYQKLKTTARDYQGTLKHQRTRLAQETHNLQALSDTDGMEERAHQLHHELNALLTERQPNMPSLDQTQSKVESLLSRIESLSETVLKSATPMLPGKEYRAVADATDDLNAIESDLNVNQTLLSRSANEYAELESVMREFTTDGEVSVENVDQFVADCDTQIERLVTKIDQFHDIVDPDLVRRDNEQVLDLAMHLFSQLPENGDRRYSRTSADAAKARIREQEVIINKARVAVQKINARLQLIQSAKDIECPSCLYVWRPGFSEDEVAQNEQWLTEHDAIIEQAQQAIQRENAFLEENDEFGVMYMQFKGYVNSYHRLRPLWNFLMQNDLYLTNPKGQHGVFLTWRRDTELNVELATLRHKRQHAIELAERQSKMGSAAHFSQRMATLHDEIDNLTQAMGDIRVKAKSVRQFRDRMLRMNEAAAQLENSVKELERSQELLVNAQRNQLIDDAVRTHQIELASIQHKLTEKRTLEGVVLDLEKDHENVNIEYKAFQLLSKALSPDEGLIAEMLSSFIGCLVAQVNSVITAIWTYDMTVLPCGLEEGDLDYKFPVQVEGNDRLSPDISQTSKGMEAMINFAFMLTVMLYMGLEDYPLYLDEPGEGFDEQHRTNLMNFIKQLMDSGRYSQLFMISHFATSHGAFLNSQILVLDGTNIAVPSGHNTHVLLD